MLEFTAGVLSGEPPVDDGASIVALAFERGNPLPQQHFIADPDPITFCEGCALAAGDLVPLPNSPRVGVNCYDNVYSWGSWPLAESDDDEG